MIGESSQRRQAAGCFPRNACHIRNGKRTLNRRSRREPGFLEAIEDEAEAELVFVAVGVAVLKHVFDRQLRRADP